MDDKVCTLIVTCGVLHKMAIIWKQPMLEINSVTQRRNLHLRRPGRIYFMPPSTHSFSIWQVYDLNCGIIFPLIFCIDFIIHSLTIAVILFYITM